MNKPRKQKNKHKKKPVKPVTDIWTKIGVIATCIGVLVAIIAIIIPMIKENRIEKLKHEINEKAAIIEATFHPNEIIIDSLSTPDVQLVKEFQTSTIKLVGCWKSVDNMVPIKQFRNVDSQEFSNIVESQLVTINTFYMQTSSVLANMKAIQDYGLNNGVESYLFRKDKQASLSRKSQENLEMYKRIVYPMMQRNADLIIRYGKEPAGIPTRKLVKVFKPIEKLYNSIEPLDFINSLFAYCIEANSKYKEQISN